MTLHRPLSTIARQIASAWPAPYFGAQPYIAAMTHLESIHDHYGADGARSIVLYFLANASSWRGPIAREVKAELRHLTLIAKRGSAL